MTSGEQQTLTRGQLLDHFDNTLEIRQKTNEMAEVKLDFLGDLRRTNSCGELRAQDAGKHRRPDGMGAPAA